MFSCTADGQKLTLKCLTFQFKTIIHLTRTFTFFARARRGSGFAARYNLYAWFANSPQLSLLFETKPTLFTLGFIACANLVARFSHSTIKILFRSDRRLSFADVYARVAGRHTWRLAAACFICLLHTANKVLASILDEIKGFFEDLMTTWALVHNADRRALSLLLEQRPPCSLSAILYYTSK